MPLTLAYLDNLFLGELLIKNACCHIGYQREGKHPDTGMGGDGNLRHGGHTHGVGAKDTEGPYLRRRLIAGAGAGKIYSLAQLYAQLPGGSDGDFPKLRGEAFSPMRGLVPWKFM